ncbi:MAG: endonuclease/exonuclease/phosphatase family protein [Phycisphaerales bacterium]|nr:endonuclease/exonuclease/phosphatase family protein [Phycisphaerales bacterium]
MALTAPILLALSVSAASPQPLTLMTFNVRYDNAADGEHAWPARRDQVATTIRDVFPEAVAVQEALPHQLDWLLRALPQYTQVGTPRTPDGEFSGLLIDPTRLEVLASGQIWLSESPDTPASAGWDAALPRTATWARTRRAGTSGPVVLLIGTHFDHVGEAARQQSASLIAAKLTDWCDEKPLPIAVLGDFNAPPGSATMTIFEEAGLTSSLSAGGGTFHGFTGDTTGPRIDDILLNDRWTRTRSEIVRPRSGNRPASDHDPVLAIATPKVLRGTIGMPRHLTPTWIPDGKTMAGGTIAELPEHIRAQAQRIAAVLEARGHSETDHHQLSRVLAPFSHPYALPELGLDMTDRLRNLPGHLDEIQQIAADMLDTVARPGKRPRGDLAMAESTLAFLEIPAGTFYIEEDLPAMLEVIHASVDIDFGAIAASLVVPMHATQPFFGRAKPPGVTGQILAGEHGPNGWRVVGGDGPNTYDMNLLAEVHDMGGDDRYIASELVIGDRLVVDHAGDDTYTGTARQGPAAGLFGTWIIDDRGGNDRYGVEGGRFSTGAGAFGAGMIVDRGGDDVYLGTHWSIGAAVYGVGVVMDLGAGDDQYLGDFLTDAVGGPRGFGFVLDQGGDDRHIANGPTPSIYDTPDVHAAFSQGMGFGYRRYAAGGIGLLCDLSGDDDYQAGEFSQGGGYYHSLGVLRDFGGDDVYDGNRYAQGFGVHQAFGVLIDDAGDDAYIGMTAADQGSAWDVAAGALLERGGNDTYTADGMAQGSAAQQAIAYLIDVAGNDSYQARRPAQGGSGNNQYHWDATHAFSFSLLADLGGDDSYSLDRSRDGVTLIDAAPDPAGMGVGACIDRSPSPRHAAQQTGLQ